MIDQSTTEQSISKASITPTILGLADSPHYLVGGMTDSEEFVALSEAQGVAKFRSLTMAKEFLKSINYSFACLEFQSAYDEMCGAESQKLTGQTIYF
jgi:uncharacterized protein DUF6482